jgi:pilus assembly protein CpaD
MPTLPSRDPPLARARLLCAAVLAAPLALGACHDADRIVSNSVVSDDARARHPIILVDAPKFLDVFVSDAAGRLDLRTVDQLREFAASGRESGLTPITVMMPAGSRHDAAARAALPAIRRELVAGGARGYVNVGSYPIADPALASPIRLSFQAIQAKTATRCGQWPRDLAVGSSTDDWDNKPYWNYGCASQSNLAAQVADPRDLVGARAEESSDVQMRMRAIGNVRKGTDPGTTWVVKNSNLGSAGGS